MSVQVTGRIGECETIILSLAFGGVSSGESETDIARICGLGVNPLLALSSTLPAELQSLIPNGGGGGRLEKPESENVSWQP